MHHTRCGTLLFCLLISISHRVAALPRANQVAATAQASEATQHNAAGLVKARSRDYDSAIAEFSEAIRLDPTYADAFRNRGVAEMNKGAVDAALADFSQAITLNPRNGAAFFDRGRVYARKREFDRAIDDFSAAIAINPTVASSYEDRGLAKVHKGAVDDGIADLTMAIKLDPRSAHAYLNRGFGYSKKTNDAAAFADYDQAIKLDPKFALAYSNRGEVKTRQGDPTGAIEDFNTALGLDPNRVVVYYYRGTAKLNHGDRDGAIADFTTMLARVSTHADAYAGRCQARREKGELDLALSDCSSAILLAPSNAHALTLRGQVKAARGDADGALEDVSAAITVDPADAVAYYERCRIESRRGNLDRAVTDCTDAIRLDAKLAGAYFERAAALERLGDANGADDDYSRARALDRTLVRPTAFVVGSSLGSSSPLAGTLVDGAYRAGNGVTAPRKTREVPPRYTPAALDKKIQGTVLLECVVATDGSVRDVKVLRSLDPMYGLDRQAMDAAKQWTFEPATKDGKPVPVSVTIEMAFSLTSTPTGVAPLGLPEPFARHPRAAAPPSEGEWQEQTLDQSNFRTHVWVPKGWLTITGAAEGTTVFQSNSAFMSVALGRSTPTGVTIDRPVTAQVLRAFADALAKMVGHPVETAGQVQVAGRLWLWVDVGEIAPATSSNSLAGSMLNAAQRLVGLTHQWVFVTTVAGQQCSVAFIVSRLPNASATEMAQAVELAGPVFSRVLERISFEVQSPKP